MLVITESFRQCTTDQEITACSISVATRPTRRGDVYGNDKSVRRDGRTRVMIQRESFLESARKRSERLPASGRIASDNAAVEFNFVFIPAVASYNHRYCPLRRVPAPDRKNARPRCLRARSSETISVSASRNPRARAGISMSTGAAPEQETHH